MDYYKDYQELFVNCTTRLPLNEIVNGVHPDISEKGHNATPVNNPTTTNQDGTLFNGSNQYCSIEVTSDHQVGSNDFYMSCWISIYSIPSTGAAVFYYGNDGNFYNSLSLILTSGNIIQGKIYDISGQNYISTPVLSIHTWYFIEFYRISSNLYLKYNKTPVTPITTSITVGIPTTDPACNIGCVYGSTYRRYYFNGYIKDFIFIKGPSDISKYSNLFYNRGPLYQTLQPTLSGSRGCE